MTTQFESGSLCYRVGSQQASLQFLQFLAAMSGTLGVSESTAIVVLIRVRSFRKSLKKDFALEFRGGNFGLKNADFRTELLAYFL